MAIIYSRCWDASTCYVALQLRAWHFEFSQELTLIKEDSFNSYSNYIYEDERPGLHLTDCLWVFLVNFTKTIWYMATYCIDVDHFIIYYSNDMVHISERPM